MARSPPPRPPSVQVVRAPTEAILGRVHSSVTDEAFRRLLFDPLPFRRLFFFFVKWMTFFPFPASATNVPVIFPRFRRPTSLPVRHDFVLSLVGFLSRFISSEPLAEVALRQPKLNLYFSPVRPEFFPCSRLFSALTAGLEPYPCKDFFVLFMHSLVGTSFHDFFCGQRLPFQQRDRRSV